MTTATDDLRRVPLFQGMSDRALEAVAALAVEVTFEDGQALMIQGEEGDRFLLLLDGRVAVTRDGSHVRDLDAGDFIGEISLVDGRPRTATATALGRVRALEVGRPAFLELMDRHSAVRLGVLMALTDRVRFDEQNPVC
jgi:CRP/FNR family cyclic AMP-dependent transcriptional regulator